jgi:hypothetical protein
MNKKRKIFFKIKNKIIKLNKITKKYILRNLKTKENIFRKNDKKIFEMKTKNIEIVFNDSLAMGIL